MSIKIQNALIEKLSCGTFRTARQIQQWLKEEYQLEYGKARRALESASSLPPKERPNEFRTTLAEQLKALELPKDKEMSLWVHDEIRYGLHPLLRKMWSLIRTRVMAPVNRRFKWGYLFGAIEVEGTGNEFLYTDGLAKDFDAAFIEQVVNSDRSKIHVIIGDGAGFHNKETKIIKGHSLKILE